MNQAIWMIAIILFLELLITSLILFGKKPTTAAIENVVKNLLDQEMGRYKRELEKNLEFKIKYSAYQKKARITEKLYNYFVETQQRFQLFAYSPTIENCQFALDEVIKALSFFSTHRLYFEGKQLQELEIVEKFFNETCALSNFYFKDISSSQYKDRIQKYLGNINNQVLPGILRQMENEFQNHLKSVK